MHRDDFAFGQFGENFTVEGLGDDEVCIGDQLPHRLGAVRGQPAARHVLPARHPDGRAPHGLRSSSQHGRPGFYLRVLEEGDVQAGDDVLKVAPGPEAMTVADVNALLYLAGHHDVDQLRRALRIPALSPGWQASLQALLDEELAGSPGGGNAGLTAESPPPAWRGFRTLRVTAKRSETRDVVSLRAGVRRRSAARPRPTRPIRHAQARRRRRSPRRSCAATRCRGRRLMTTTGSASRSNRTARPVTTSAPNVRVGDRLDVGAPRGSFTLDDSASPVVLVSAGVGVTPMLAMLHALHDRRSTRDIWWLHGARNRAEHAFAEETQSLLDDLAHVHRRVWYSRPAPTDRAGTDYDAVGRITPEALEEVGVPIDGEFYLCGPTAFMDALREGLADARSSRRTRAHRDLRCAEVRSRPESSPRPTRPPHQPDGAPGSGPLISFVRTGLNVRWGDGFASILELAEACDVPVRWSCRTGVCHTCETGLLDGSGRLLPRAARGARRRQRAPLLLAPRPRSRDRRLIATRFARSPECGRPRPRRVLGARPRESPPRPSRLRQSGTCSL